MKLKPWHFVLHFWVVCFASFLSNASNTFLIWRDLNLYCNAIHMKFYVLVIHDIACKHLSDSDLNLPVDDLCFVIHNIACKHLSGSDLNLPVDDPYLYSDFLLIKFYLNFVFCLLIYILFEYTWLPMLNKQGVTSHQ